LRIATAFENLKAQHLLVEFYRRVKVGRFQFQIADTGQAFRRSVISSTVGT
jgi:hypothetical protein